MATPNKQWDAFISHASEDKEAVAFPLAGLLANKGLKIWIDNQQIKIGDSLREKIDLGLAQSRFGIVILSPAFLTKHWTTQELNGLSALEVDGHKVILPVWHGISRKELAQHSPILADRLAARTIDGLDGVADQLAAEILDPKHGSPSSKAPTLARRLSNLLAQDPNSETIFEFCLQHTAVVALAAHRKPAPQVMAIKAEDTPALGFACWNPESPDDGTTLVVFGPVVPQIKPGMTELPREILEHAESVVHLFHLISAGHLKSKSGETIPTKVEAVRVFIGMRMTYFKDDVFIADVLKDFDVKVRSYDHLIHLVAWLDTKQPE